MADAVDALMGELGLLDVSVSPQPNQPGHQNQLASAPLTGPEAEVDALLSQLGPAPSNDAVVSGPGANWLAEQQAKKAMGPPSAGAGRGRPLATQTPDGRKIIHNGPPCSQCGEMVIGRVTNALGKSFHPECFVCVTCKKPFSDGRFVDHEGMPYCEADYQAMFCPTCQVCKQPITDQAVVSNEYKWHPEHFTCTGCGTKLAGKQYKLGNNGDVFCTKCKANERIALDGPKHTCAKCKLPIHDDYVMLKGQTVHAYHYRCEECGCEFKGGNCREFEGGLYCIEDYEKMMKQICESCQKPILGRVVSALGKVYHPEHFVCATCNSAFQGSNYFEHDGKAYCEYDYTQQFGDPCAKCGRPVARNAVEFAGKVYHAEHFVCHACNCGLGKKGAFAWESKPLCSKCFDKLPSDVKKKIRKKREAQAKIDKQRKKEAAAKA